MSDTDNSIVFDNLRRSTDVVGELKPVKALLPDGEPFVNANAAGEPKQVKQLSDLQKCANESGQRLKKVFGS